MSRTAKVTIALRTGLFQLGLLLLICTLPVHGQISSGSQKELYRLVPLDKLTITVFDEPDLSVEQRVDGQGYIRIPLLGNVMVGDMTLREAEDVIERKFVEERYLKNPQVTLFVTEYSPKEVSVFGEVKEPGQISFPLEANSIDIVEVIARAGDFTGVARMDSVRVTRNRFGQEQTFEVDVEDIITGREDSRSRNVETFLVMPGDVIYVDERIF